MSASVNSCATHTAPSVAPFVTLLSCLLTPCLAALLPSTQIPDPSVVTLYLTEIAKAYGVEYTPRQTSLPQGLMSSTIGVPLPLPGMATSIPEPINLSTLGQPSAAAMPTVQVPVATHIPVATNIPVAGPMPAAGSFAVAGAAVSMPTASFVPTPFTVVLTKGSSGLGLSLDAHNVVTVVKPGSEAERIGTIQPGDLVLSLNGIAVSDDHPVKTIAIDMPEGAAGTFVLLRRGAAAPVATAPTAYGLPTQAGALPVQPSYGYPHTEAVQMPAVQMPPVQPAPAPVQPVAAPVASEDPDDILARRLEALKRL